MITNDTVDSQASRRLTATARGERWSTIDALFRGERRIESYPCGAGRIRPFFGDVSSVLGAILGEVRNNGHQIRDIWVLHGTSYFFPPNIYDDLLWSEWNDPLVRWSDLVTFPENLDHSWIRLEGSISEIFWIMLYLKNVILSDST